MGSDLNSSILSVRVTRRERALLETAAEQAGASLSDFVRRKSVEAAEAEVLERSNVVIPASDWEAFEAWAKAPGSPNDRLRALMALTPTWER